MNQYPGQYPSTGGPQHGGFSSGKSKIEEAIRQRNEADKIMSPLWCLAPLLGMIVLWVAMFFGMAGMFMFSTDDDPALGGVVAAVAIIVGIVVYIALVAYPWYLMIKRRSEHFKRDHLLMSGITEYLSQKSSEKNINMAQELATLNSITAEANSQEDDKSPVIYTIVALIVPVIGMYYVLYFLMKDIYAHHQRIAVFMQYSQMGLNKMGKNVVVPSWKTLPERSFLLYFILACICSPFGIYWMYTLIKDYNDHFKNQWQFEDQILSGGSSQYQSYGQGPPMGQQQYQQPPQYGSQPQYGSEQQYQQPPPYGGSPPPHGGDEQQYQQPPPQEMGQPCLDCGSNMRYIQEYNRWYCEKCQGYK